MRRHPPRQFAVPAITEAEPRHPPRVLFVTCHLPWPPTSGGRRRELELLKRVCDGFDVHLVVVSKTLDEDQANAAMVERFCRRVELLTANESAPTGCEPPAVRRHRCPAAGERIARILERGEVDLIHVEGFYLMQHVPDWTEVPILLVEQNVEYELERQRAELDGHPESIRRFMVTEADERQCWSRATSLAAVTAEDSAIVNRTLPERAVAVVPDGADHMSNLRLLSGRAALPRPPGPLAALVANFGYAPNVDAARYLYREILPLIHAQVPDLTLWLVGDAPPPEVQAMAGEHVCVTGRVPDVAPYLDAADLILCPLRVGGGIKVKTIEALRRGKAVVTTSIGAQGLPGPARSAVAVADEPRAFADAAAGLLCTPERRRVLERRAGRAAGLLPSWDDAADALIGIYEGLLADRLTPAEAIAGGVR